MTSYAVMLNEAKTSRPRTELRGRGQDYEVEAKNNYKKYQIMINNVWFKIIAGKINKIPEFYTIFARKVPDYIVRQRDRGQAETKTSRPRPKFWAQGHFGLEDLTSLILCLRVVNVCHRTEIKHGAEILAEKIKKYRPKIAAFNGKGQFCLLNVKMLVWFGMEFWETPSVY